MIVSILVEFSVTCLFGQSRNGACRRWQKRATTDLRHDRGTSHVLRALIAMLRAASALYLVP
jgi:hypothetical protein